tara:strand:+ start:480 stop:1103 length:624 start_codon:yes stop_codon:yes gene_type:complete
MMQGHTQKIYEALKASVDQKKSASFIVSGGSSPIKIFNELSNSDLEWDKVDIALVDERVVKTSHNDSNENMLRKQLLINNAAKANYISLLNEPKKVLAIKKPFDVVLLGMGEDGHFASLFTDHIANNPMDVDHKIRPNIINTKPMGDPLYERVSMNLSMILRASKIFLLVSNERKLNVLEKSVTDNSFPVFYLLNQNKVNIEILGGD